MKFALLGDDPIVQPLIREIASRPDCQITHAALMGQREAEILQLSPAVRIVNGWEELLSNETNAVIVCGSIDLIDESTKQLAAAGRSLVIFPQGAWDTELIYELSLARDDNGVRLIPACPLLEHPLFHETHPQTPDEKEDDPNNRIIHLRLEREVPLPAGTELTESALRVSLLPDVGLLRKLGGEYHQVTAVKSSTPTGGIVLATITLSGDNLPDAVLTLRPVLSNPRWQLTITRNNRTEIYQSDGQDRDIRKIEGETEICPPFKAGKAVLEHIERSLASLNTRPDWTDITRDYEVLDAVRRSFARRRTIDLHFETTSERSLFKTQMTAIGCGVLMLTLFAVVAVLVLGAALDARDPVEIKAQKANTIFYEDEFLPDDPKLTPDGRKHWEEVEFQRRDPSIIPILVEKGAEEALSRERAQFLIDRLENEGISNAEQRVEVYTLEGPWFESVMRVARIVVFLPLFVFLGLQFLLLIARPARPSQNSEKKS